MTRAARVEFVGEEHVLDPDTAFTIGREGDLVVDADNAFLHRQFLVIRHTGGLWWLSNVGGQLSATVSDAAGALQAWLAPGASLPLVVQRTVVWFTAGATTYELEVVLTEPVFEAALAGDAVTDGTPTIGRITLTPAQKLLVVALCENALRHGDRGASSIPTSAAAAARLGWPLTRFNRKLDNVCERLSALGVRGLHGGPDRLASSRKARLVEYAMATRIVAGDDLKLLEHG